jgi:hypothetical protein
MAGFVGFSQSTKQSMSPLAQWLFKWMSLNAPMAWQSALVAGLLIMIQAFFINYIAASQQIIYRESVMPGLFFIFLCSLYPNQLELTPQLIANTFLIFLVYRLCYLYEAPKPVFPVLDGGMMLGLGLLFDFDLIIYLPFILLSVLYMASFNIRHLLVALLGMILPVYFLAAILFLNDSQGKLFELWQYTIDKSFFKPIGITLEKSWIWFLLLPIIFVSLVQFQLNFFRNKVKTRRVQLMIGIMLPFGIISLFAGDYGFELGLNYLAIPFSFILANFYVRNSWMWFKEISFIALLLGLVYYQYLMRV